MTGPFWYRPGAPDAVPHATVLDDMAGGDVVLLGEQHDRADMHRWQLHVAAGLLARRPLILGFEMFPARMGPVLSEWVAGELAEEEFLQKAEWGTVWGFPADLYLPLFRFCRETGTPMLGLNCRRGLVSEVGKGGWESVREEDREGLTPARPSPEAYRRHIFDLTGNGQPGRSDADPDSPRFSRFLRAQEVWDRAFATRLAAAVRTDGPLLVGIVGMGHLAYGGGVSWQLADLGVTDVRVAIPHSTEQAKIKGGAADYAMCLA
ncbi:ChaN family lipoprotein [Roseicyclus sp. F158]|uniref:ChaN family lipoprotein n=1 Tax=Tropicimonas omnivorans TaxID=3075590 RepID=A0ABU3DH27_9RHOB|nr:ChaN family lipoprotein [Roseicyclus sp. F158]MDT0683021.1 ChaN family lipoprotein [Roseicyclus sp. F158]